MTDLDDLVQEQCGFCECGWDDELDEPLVPLHLGDPPQPQPVRSQGISGNTAVRSSRYEKKRLDALLNALRDMDGMEYEVHDAVEEVKSVGGESHWTDAGEYGSTPDVTAFESEVNYDKSAATLRFHPEARDVEPDAMVCQECAEMFRSLGE